MEGFDIVMVIAIILFARLGVRLVSRYRSMKKEGGNDSDNPKPDHKRTDIE